MQQCIHTLHGLRGRTGMDCWAIVWATHGLHTFPVTLPLTPPSGLLRAVILSIVWYPRLAAAPCPVPNPLPICTTDDDLWDCPTMDASGLKVHLQSHVWQTPHSSHRTRIAPWEHVPRLRAVGGPATCKVAWMCQRVLTKCRHCLVQSSAG